MTPKFAAALVLAIACLASSSPRAAEAAKAEKPRVYALVSAIGGEITVVRNKLQVGSNLQPYRKYPVPMQDPAIDTAVLRGLDRAVASEDPDSERIFMRLNPDEVKDVYGYQRGDVLGGKALKALEAMPERKNWHRIILVVPRFMNAEREGMGQKLYGIGLYVQNIGRTRTGMGITDTEIETANDPETISPEGVKGSSYRFVAPYFYATLYVIDAPTMKVLETNERYDFQRIYDPKSPALDVAQQMPVEQLTQMVESFVEKASARALNDQQGEVIIREPKVVNPSVK